MDHQDRQAIEGLFSKLGEVERQAGPRDAEADALIRARITAQPAAPYTKSRWSEPVAAKRALRLEAEERRTRL